MTSQALLNECSISVAKAMTDILPPCSPEERRAFFESAILAARAGLASYEERAERSRRRLRPSETWKEK